MNKITPAILLGLAALIGGSPAFLHGADKKDGQPKKQKAPPLPGAGTGGNTPHATTSTVIGPDRASGNRITVVYGRPNIKHPRTGEVRQVWGQLEKWDKPYRLGADEATLLITQKPIEVAGKTIPAGAYTLYLIPSEGGTSQLAFSKKIGDWGVPVDTKSDVARVDLKKEKLASKVEQLTITIENGAPESNSGTLKIAWDALQFSVPFKTKQS